VDPPIDPRIPARQLNPDAGSYLISAHPAELAAAASATQATYVEFPYYEARYGDRGRRFSHSDSAWIITLCDKPFERARSQLLWLAAMLAARGMPRFLLERHLLMLEHALGMARPEQHARYAVLGRCAAHFAHLRHLRLDGDRFESLAARFEAAVEACPERVPNVGRVLVAAVLDEAARVRHARTSVEAWVCDAQRFSARWIEAVRESILHTRASLSRPRPARATVRR
jgi:hypothetical protein